MQEKMKMIKTVFFSKRPYLEKNKGGLRIMYNHKAKDNAATVVLGFTLQELQHSTPQILNQPTFQKQQISECTSFICNPYSGKSSRKCLAPKKNL